MSAPPATQALSRRAFAKLVGRSETVIRRLIQRGDLAVDANDQIPMPEGLRAYAAVRSLEPAFAAPTPVSAGEAPSAPDEAAVTPSASPRTPTPAQAADLALKQTRARREEMRYQREAGELLPRAEVEADAQRTCGAIRAGLVALPARVALVVEALCAEGAPRPGAIRAAIEFEVNQLLELLQARLAAPPAKEGAA
jgi:hypothetical protein